MEKDIPLVEVKNGYLIRDYDSEHNFRNFVKRGSGFFEYGKQGGKLLVYFQGTAYSSKFKDAPFIESAYIHDIFGPGTSNENLKKECLVLLEKWIIEDLKRDPFCKEDIKINFKVNEIYFNDVFEVLENVKVSFGALCAPELNKNLLYPVVNAR
ncbi:MAG: hypothetical protein PHQ66_01310 [Candidatus Nanoarchaeia archaeon]|nr:hypothetical protein [Candidatus Nanoarchaeia archaeon]MDD5357984.1 hypothetical protein [Candidatus Nanoarchaeia archaeon]MDD5588903.1 hypothetical protein [Candidatus Nanoarchaeia archaeon]